MGEVPIKEHPFQISISFKNLIDKLEHIANTDPVKYRVEYANSLLEACSKVPELYTGFSDIAFYNKHIDLISNLISELFPTALTNNEIKAISFPFVNIVFNLTERFKKILNDAGNDFKFNMYDIDDSTYYILCCNLILNKYYGEKLEVTRSLKFEIPDKLGIKNYYKLNYNVDFIEVFPTEKSVKITPEIVEILIQNVEDINLWKKYFPVNSWILKGFGILNLFDITMDHAVSKLKSTLIGTSFENLLQVTELSDLYESIFRIPNISMGFLGFDDSGKIIKLPEIGSIKSISANKVNDEMISLIPKNVMKKMKATNHYEVYNTEMLLNSEDEDFVKLGNHYKNNNVGSIILAPIIRDNKIVNITELASPDVNAFNNLNAQKIENFMPFVDQTAERMKNFAQSQLEVIIQKEFTSIHKSVYWRFLEEAKKYQDSLIENKSYNFQEIRFKNVLPIYGVSDIKSSTKMRIKASQQDLKNQLTEILDILNLDETAENSLIIEQRKIEILHYLEKIQDVLFYSTEYEIVEFINNKIHNYFRSNIFDNAFGVAVINYFNKIDSESGLYYIERKKYDQSINLVNIKLSKLLDYRQIEAQEIFPHYYERFISDGIDFNMYIGSSISPDRIFDKVYTQNLRLWQLQVMCEMDRTIENLSENMEHDIHLTSLIFVYSNSINVKFRMEEKKFDIDGSMNALYEAVKKRLEKAYIKGTSHRIVEKNKLTIVYNNTNDELEYNKYLTFLQLKNVVGKKVEYFEIEEMQSISGYKGMRVDILNNEQPKNYYSFNDFLKTKLSESKS